LSTIEDEDSLKTYKFDVWDGKIKMFLFESCESEWTKNFLGTYLKNSKKGCWYFQFELWAPIMMYYETLLKDVDCVLKILNDKFKFGGEE